MKTLLLVGKRGKPEAAALASQIRQWTKGLPWRVVADRHLSEALQWDRIDDRTLADSADLAMVLGGDGTLIHAARLLSGRPVPILGVNLGSLGFMTELRQEDLGPLFQRMLSGDFKTESRMKLACRLRRRDKVVIEDEVLNDVVINKGALARIADHDCFVDGEYVTTYKADGIIVATPTGSTAYALSAGGPIVHPSVDGVIIAPICSHALTQRAIVVPGDRVIRISLKSESADVYLTIDGQTGVALETGDELEVQRSPNRVLLVRNPSVGYFGILRQKLHWGER